MDQETRVRTKHGIILDCQLHIQSDNFPPEIAEMIGRYFSALYLNQRYGFRDESGKNNLHLSQIDQVANDEYLVEVAEWLESKLQH